jgi:hypothetical protein
MKNNIYTINTFLFILIKNYFSMIQFLNIYKFLNNKLIELNNFYFPTCYLIINLFNLI